jgi:hypothetical protein
MNLLPLLTPLRRPALLFALVTLPAMPVRALEWTRELITLTPEKGATVVRTQFEFTNRSMRPVQVLGVSTSCGCTEANIATSEIAAGASGTLDVLFTVGNRSGLQEKEIVVTTDDAKEPKRLQLKIQLPPAASARK